MVGQKHQAALLLGIEGDDPAQCLGIVMTSLPGGEGDRLVNAQINCENTLRARDMELP